MIILERFEYDYAFVEIEGEMMEIEKYRVNQCVKEGDVLRLEDGIYYKDNEATKNRKQYIEDKFRDMWED